MPDRRVRYPGRAAKRPNLRGVSGTPQEKPGLFPNGALQPRRSTPCRRGARGRRRAFQATPEAGRAATPAHLPFLRLPIRSRRMRPVLSRQGRLSLAFEALSIST